MANHFFIDALFCKSRQFAGKAALIENDLVLSYGELWQRINEYASAFTSLRLDRGKLVIVYLEDSIELALVFLALVQSGASPLILNREKMGAETFGDLNFYGLIADGPDGSAHESRFVVNGKWRLFLNAGYEEQGANTGQRLLFTSSGSTGVSKITAITPKGALINIKANCRSLKISARDTTLLFLPLSYSYGLSAQLLSHLHEGASIVFAKSRIYILQLNMLIRRYAVSTLFTVPTLLRQFISVYRPAHLSDDFGTLRCVTVGGNHVDAFTLKKALGIFRCPLAITYGLAEAGPRVCTRFIHSARENDLYSVGRPIPGVRIRIEGRRKLALPAGSKGRIRVISPSVALGYLNQPSSDILPGKQVLTKDFGYVTPRGRLVILGRMQNYILLGNKRLWFFQIEDLLYSTGKIAKVQLEKKNDSLDIRLLQLGQARLTTDEVRHLLRRQFGREMERRTTIGFVAPHEIRTAK
jgi:long-chain acyl-CoA synthetase